MIKKIFILMLVVASVCACESKEEKEFLDLMAHTEFYDGVEDYLSFRDGFKTMAEEIEGDEYKFRLSNVYERNGTYIGIYVYHTKDESSYYDDGAYTLFGFFLTGDDFGHEGNIKLYAYLEDDDISELDTSFDNLFDELFNYGEIIGKVNKDKKVSSKNRDKNEDYSNGWEYIKETLQYDGSLVSERYEKYFDNKDGDFIVKIEIDGSEFSITQVDNLMYIQIDLNDGKAYSFATSFISLDGQSAKALIKKAENYVKIVKSKEGNTKQVKMMQEIINRAKNY